MLSTSFRLKHTKGQTLQAMAIHVKMHQQYQQVQKTMATIHHFLTRALNHQVTLLDHLNDYI